MLLPTHKPFIIAKLGKKKMALSDAFGSRKIRLFQGSKTKRSEALQRVGFPITISYL